MRVVVPIRKIRAVRRRHLGHVAGRVVIPGRHPVAPRCVEGARVKMEPAVVRVIRLHAVGVGHGFWQAAARVAGDVGGLAQGIRNAGLRAPCIAVGRRVAGAGGRTDRRLDAGELAGGIIAFGPFLARPDARSLDLIKMSG